MTDPSVQSIKEADDALDPREAQERLVEAFGEGDIAGAHGGLEPEGSSADEEAVPATPTGEGRVVTLSGDDDIPVFDNPFAQEAAETLWRRKLEALLFASSKPLTEAMLGERLPGANIPELLEALSGEYDGRGINLRCVDKKWQFVTASDVASVLVEERKQERKLSRAALETLSIIAYHQPCSRADIEEVRGVAVAKGSLDQLLELGWVKIRGRREVPGRPLLYGTTSAFLEHFGLESLTHLPGLSDLKAAGLLDARLPPGFSVPTPASDDDDEAGGALAEGAEAPEFIEDFMEGAEDADPSLDDRVDE